MTENNSTLKIYRLYNNIIISYVYNNMMILIVGLTQKQFGEALFVGHKSNLLGIILVLRSGPEFGVTCAKSSSLLPRMILNVDLYRHISS